MDKNGLKERFLKKTRIFLSKKKKSGTRFSQKWQKIVHSWKEDASYLTDSFCFFRKKVQGIPNLVRFLEKKKHPLRLFFFLFVLTGTGILVTALFLIVQGKSDSAFCLHAAFIALAAIFCIFLLKGNRS